MTFVILTSQIQKSLNKNVNPEHVDGKIVTKFKRSDFQSRKITGKL